MPGKAIPQISKTHVVTLEKWGRPRQTREFKSHKLNDFSVDINKILESPRLGLLLWGSLTIDSLTRNAR